MANSLVRIPLEESNGTVSLEIEVSGLLIWQLAYVSEDGTYYRGTDHPKGNTILLGKSEALIGDTDVWKLIISSPDSQNQQGTIVLRWLENGQTRAMWEKELNTSTSEYGGMGRFTN